MEKIPVILDTDIGGDIDDTWALAMMLNSPELDVRLAVSDVGNTTYRSKLIARMLEVAGRSDIPVAVGIETENRHSSNQLAWVKDYDLDSYPGTVHADGVQAIIDTVLASDQKTTLCCIGPVPNIGRALDLAPEIVEKVRFVGMHGSLRRGHNPEDAPIAECNVVHNTLDCRKAFTQDWDITITPLDTCADVILDGELYQQVHTCRTPMMKALMENYRIWAGAHKRDADVPVRSSTLFDTVAVHLCYSEEYLEMEDLGVRVTDDGFTVIDETAKTIRCATAWKDLDGFKEDLVARLTKN